MNIRLAKKNREVSPKSWEALREKSIVDKIRNGRKENGKVVRKARSANEELAILRKSVKYLYDLISTLHPDEIENTEFVQYYSDVEKCKEESNEDLSDH